MDSYEKYVLECEEKERAEMLDQIDDEKKSLEMSEKWKERRECLDMLKRELQRVRDGKDMTDWDSLLDEELKKHADLDPDKLFEEEQEEEQEQEEEEEEEKEQQQQQQQQQEERQKKKVKKEKLVNKDDNREKDELGQKNGKGVKVAAEIKKEK